MKIGGVSFDACNVHVRLRHLEIVPFFELSKRGELSTGIPGISTSTYL
jgi:hypothetical protein